MPVTLNMFDSIFKFLQAAGITPGAIINFVLVLVLFGKLIGNHLKHLTSALEKNTEAIDEISKEVVVCKERISKIEGVIKEHTK